MKPIIAAAAALIATAGFGAATPHAQAGVLVSGLIKQQRLCATVYNNRLQTNNCNGGDAQNWFTTAYGQQHYHNLCLDGDNGNPNDYQLVVTTCANKPSQRWSLWKDGTYHNESGWCMDINGGSPYEGAKIGRWKCNGLQHQVWATGVLEPISKVFPPALLSNMPAPKPGQVLSPAGKLIGSDSAGVIAAGGGNVIAAGGGNVIAAGGGNVIVMNGGAVVGPAAGS